LALKTIENISLYGNDLELKRQEIKTYFNDTFDIYEKLFEVMASEEAYYQRADSLRHPLIFYFGHTATFFINKLVLAKVISKRIDPKLESIFAVGVDEMSWDDLNEKHYAWPTLEETKEYRDSVRELVNGLIDTLPLTLPITWESPFWVILMGIEHERIHLETSSVLIRQLPVGLVMDMPDWKVCQDIADAPENELIDVKGGKVILGKSKEDDFYGWDNEYGHHESEISDFKASKYLVSNGDFLEFVKDGGYEKVEFWEEEGREWLKFSKAKEPTFWIDGSKLRFMTKIVEMPQNHPFEVNYHEAKAYCNWLGKKEGKSLRLPTEDEWYRLVEVSKINKSNINLEYFASTTPVDKFNHGKFYDLVGNVWQWSETAIYPFEGFEVHPIYDDFTTPTFDTQHNLIKGGSWISTGNETLLSARYAFRRHFFQHAGFRYVESDEVVKVEENIYESDELISQYAEFGWGESSFEVDNYPETCVKLSLAYMKDKPKKRALDIGCAIGRSSFELAREFDEVVGLDFTARFISLATRMKEDKKIGYEIVDEGELTTKKIVSLKEFGLEDEAEKVSFFQADACNLKPHYHGYDLIFAGNLIDRLYAPKKFLKDIHERLNDGGMFILTSPYTWLEEFTKKEDWIGGFRKDGEIFRTLDGLKEVLGKDFNLLDTKDIPFVIRETSRKHQHTVAQMSVWQKK
jgi:5-histidylcysteine sulfoxide synthase/putative 4-mercaptohistidine N1-methyltranferase